MAAIRKLSIGLPKLTRGCLPRRHRRCYVGRVSSGNEILIGGGLDPVTSALIVRLLQVGMIAGEDIEAMARRLPDAEAIALRVLIIEAAIDDSPEAMRAGFHAIEGGNDSP